jgi:hypothetical protein
LSEDERRKLEEKANKTIEKSIPFSLNIVNDLGGMRPGLIDKGG